MGIGNVPLAVRLWSYQPGLGSTPTEQFADRQVTRELRELTFRSSVPGGFQSASFSLDRSLTDPGLDLAAYNGVAVYDTRSAAVVWEGVIEDVGKGVGSDGETWHLSATGTAAHAGDQTSALFYVDRRLDAWEPVEPTVKSWTVGTENRDSDDAESIMLRWPQGSALPDGTGNPEWCAMQYRQIWYAGQKLALFGGYFQCGQTDGSGDHRFQGLVRSGGGGFIAAEDRNWTMTDTPFEASISTDWSAGQNQLRFRSTWYGAPGPTIITETNWVRLTSVYVRATVYDKTGVEITTPYGNDFTTPNQVVEDLLGRLLDRYDGANAQVAGNVFHISQLVYPESATASQVLDDVLLFQPDHYWAAWETNPLTGLYRFEYLPWPSVIGYEADVQDGFDASSGSVDLFNKVLVRYRDPLGRTRTVTRTQTVTELDRAGVTRSAPPIDVADELASATNAAQIGDMFLAEHRIPPNGGTLTVARPVIDVENGRMCQPWEIRPGRLIRVRGVQPRADALNATARDGVTVFKIVGVDYNASSNTASLELDSQPRTVAQLLARLENRRIRKR